MAAANHDAVISEDMIIAGDLAGVERALAAGADPSRSIGPGFEGDTTTSVLALAVQFGREDIFTLLMTNGAAFLNEKEEQDSLAEAAEDGHLEIVRSLLDAGRVNVDSLCEGTFPGMTPLMCAARGVQAEMIHLLLEAGADFNIKTPDYGFAALDYAFIGDFSTAQDAIVLRLLDAGCTAYRKSPLMWAASEGRLSLIEKLITGGAPIHDIHSEFPEKPTALSQARNDNVKEFMLAEIRKREKYTAAALSVMPQAIPEAVRRKIIGLLRRW